MLATFLREVCVKAFIANRNAKEKDVKIDMIYNYLTGGEFSNRLYGEQSEQQLICQALCAIRPKNPTDQEKFNPVQNSYAALWSEYWEVDTTVPVLNVIRRILEYYFIQLHGYDSVNIHKKVLDDNKEKFIEPVENGQPDYTKYHLASSMLSYISVSSVGFSDGLNYVVDCVDINLYKTVFKLIFEALQQEQHYKMMMGEEEKDVETSEAEEL